MKKQKLLKSTVSLVLAGILAFQGPLSECALAEPQADNLPLCEDGSASVKTPSPILGEDVSQREEAVKHFRHSDLTTEAVAYPYPVHYEENGQWKDIDNTLEAVRQEDGSLRYRNRQGDYYVLFSETADDGALLRFERGDYAVSFSLPEGAASRAKVENGAVSEDVRLLPNLFSSITYPDAKPGMDLTYTVGPEGIREYFTVKSEEALAAPDAFEISVECEGVSPKAEGGRVAFVNDAGEEVFAVKEPLMEDAAGEASAEIEVRLEEETALEEVLVEEETSVTPAAEAAPTVEPAEEPTAEPSAPEAMAEPTAEPTPETAGEPAPEPESATWTYRYTLVPDSGWLEEEERVFPIVIDPDLTTSVNKTYIDDTYVSSGEPDSANGYGQGRIKIGYGSSSKINRAYIKLTSLPKLAPGDVIVQADLNLFRYADENTTAISYGHALDLHGVSQNWSEGSMTWNSRAAYNTRVESTSISGNFLQDPALYVNRFDITRLVKQWYSGAANYGVMIKNADETKGYHEYISGEALYLPDYHPFASILYINSIGIESTWSYHEQAAGRAGTVAVNDYTGGVCLIHSDAAVDAGKFPLSLSHVYNTGDKDVNEGYGLGWRLNYAETVKKATIGEKAYYRFTDGDGTRHYYYPDAKNTSLWYDEQDKKNKLTVSGGTCTIEDASFTKRSFDSAGRLSKVSDPNGNSMSFTYDGSGHLTKIVDGAGRATTLTYSSGLLAKVAPPDGLSVTYSYTSSRLTKITYSDGKASTYQYDSAGNLTGVSNHDGYRLAYAYDGASPARVSSVQEYGGSEKGGSLKYSYGWNVTKTTDAKGRTSLVRFNDNGQALSVQDAKGNAAYVGYETEQGKKKELTNASQVFRTSVNLLRPHEVMDASLWRLEGSGAAYAWDKGKDFIYGGSLRIDKGVTESEAYVYLPVTVQGGKEYTFSAYFNGCTGASIRACTDAGVPVKTTPELLMRAGEWNRGSITFTALSGASGCRVGILLPAGCSGTLYAAAVQLECAPDMGRYNLLDNSDYTYGARGWGGLNMEAGDEKRAVSKSDGLRPENLDEYAYAIHGTNASKGIYQTVTMSGKAGDSFVFAGWAKAESIPAYTHKQVWCDEQTNGICRLELGFEKADGTWAYETADFSSDTGDWQYLSASATAPADYTAVRLNINYTRNRNTLYVDGMQLYKEVFGECYTYNDKGDLVQAVDREKKKESYTYDDAGNLTKIVDKYGDITTCTYDGKHNLLTSASNGTLVTYTYDSKGNALTSQTNRQYIDTWYLKTGMGYTDAGSFLASRTDELGNTVRFTYDTAKGLQTSATDAKGGKTSYTYNGNKQLTRVEKASGSGTASVAYGYSGDVLSEIRHNGFAYALSTDLFGNRRSVSAAGRKLVDNTYDNTTGLLTKSTYGNGYALTYIYDGMDRIREVKNGSTVLYRYHYDADGRLREAEDAALGVRTQYDYGLEGKIARNLSDNGDSCRYTYDEKGNLLKSEQTAGGVTWATGYTYDDRQIPEKTILSNGIELSVTRNKLDLVTEKFIGFETPHRTAIQYNLGADGNRSTQISLYKNANRSAYVYTYDANGNITEIRQGSAAITYRYDALDEMVREDNPYTGKTVLYDYDLGGNLLAKHYHAYTTADDPGEELDTVTYGYDGAWKDLLTEYDGEAITYDAIGNPLAYRGKTLTWEGRRLKSLTGAGASGAGLSCGYQYNLDGLRTKKTVDGDTYTYHYNGSLLMMQEVTRADGSRSVQRYSYDSDGNVVSVNYDGADYYYLRNAQNDIVEILDSTGASKVLYQYDSWGKLLKIQGSGAYTIGRDNPFRYRGYYYDTESGLYYLQSRYYDPEVGRWINADSQLNTSLGVLGCNMFAYCLNTPVNKVDYSGNKPGDLFDTIDEAARDFALCYNEASISNNVEYGTSIYRVITVVTTYKPVIITHKFLWWTWKTTSILANKTITI